MWLFNEQPFNQTPEDYHGFVYMITEISTGKKYIGKKYFWKPKTLPVNKTRKRRVKTRVESDWRDYWGSSIGLQEMVKTRGENQYKREILKLCETKGDCSYWEAKMQFHFDVLLRDDFYNEFIGVKIHSKHLSTTTKKTVDISKKQGKIL